MGLLPTPLEPSPRLGAELGLELLWKRDDFSGFEVSGNKIRKLEYLLAEAEAEGADTLVTAGGVQSNHCRATAFAAARRGLGCTLLLRTADPTCPPPVAANSLLDRLAGAELRWAGAADWGRRDGLMEEIAAELRWAGRRPYLIPVGGSNALGCWGYLTAVAELRAQLPAAWRGQPVTLVVACGSGGTAAGLALGLADAGWTEARVVAFAVCDDAATFEREIGRLVGEARARWPGLPPLRPGSLEIDDRFIGPGYAQATPQGYEIIRRAARRDGVLLDHVYTGKAFLGLATRARELGPRVVFVHTGGGFGLLVAGEALLAE